MARIISPAAYIVGDVEIGEGTIVGAGTVIRGERWGVKIGDHCLIGNNCVIHHNGRDGTTIGDHVVMEPGACCHAKSVGDSVIMEMGSYVCNLAELGDCSVIGAGSVVNERRQIPGFSFAAGVPAAIDGKVSSTEVAGRYNAALPFFDGKLSAGQSGSAEVFKSFRGKSPRISTGAFVSRMARIIGDVEIAEGTVISAGVVIRGDEGAIRIGRNSFVGDNAIVHVDSLKVARIGERVAIGPGAKVHAQHVGNSVFIGMGATVCNFAEIGDGCIIGARAVVPQGKVINPGSFAAGIPANVKGKVASGWLSGWEPSGADRVKEYGAAEANIGMATAARHSSFSGIAGSAHISDRALLIGKVEVGEQSSIWCQVVLFSSFNRIKIGANTIIQDGCVVQEPSPEGAIIGDSVVLGPGVISRASKIGSYTLVGLGAVLGKNAEIGEHCLVGAGSVLPENARIPDDSFVAGVPATVRGCIDSEQRSFLNRSAEYTPRVAAEQKEHGI